jgi:hypothetical protein
MSTALAFASEASEISVLAYDVDEIAFGICSNGLWPVKVNKVLTADNTYEVLWMKSSKMDEELKWLASNLHASNMRKWKSVKTLGKFTKLLPPSNSMSSDVSSDVR